MIEREMVVRALVASSIPYKREYANELTTLLNKELEEKEVLKSYSKEVSGDKWYWYVQNNSGGGFIDNEDVGTSILVEASCESGADERMEDITRYYSDYCECCGERWGSSWKSFYTVGDFLRENPKSTFNYNVVVYPKVGEHYKLDL